MKNIIKLSLSIFLIITINSCSKDKDIPTYKLTTIVNPISGGSISPATGTFQSGETVSLTATPATNFEFKNWTGDATGTDNPVVITMSSDKTVSAIFELKDDDGDGVTNDIDNCPDTPSGEEVDDSGCSSSQIDMDGDGITNDIDQCENTPTGEEVNENGCSASQLDDDGDGITNDIDQCENTPNGEEVDANGCSDSQDSSLLGLYFLDGNANDSSGYQNNSLFVGNVTPTQNRNGIPDAAMIFEANDSYLEVADSNLLSPDSSISISVWVNSNNPLANTFQAIVNKIEQISGTNSFQGYYLGINSSNVRLRWNITSNVIETTTAFPSNQWVHIVAIYSNGVQKLFVDNTLIGESTIGSQPLNNNVNFRIGAQSQIPSGGNGGFIGAIDDVYVYDRELTESEIANLYNN
jgi:hypothetical protein